MQQERTCNDKTTIKPQYNPAEFRRYFLEIMNNLVFHRSGGDRNLILTDEMIDAVELVCQYMNTEPKLLKNEGWGFAKGLWIYGAFGSGKTILMLTYREVRRRLFQTKCGFKTCVEMNDAFLKMDVYTNKIHGMHAIKNFCDRSDPVERIFDDLGEEETTVNHYGNKFCIMAQILSERHKGFPKTKTHVTTNLRKDQVGEMYGGRIDSRMYEMFNFIRLGGSSNSIDHRKNK